MYRKKWKLCIAGLVSHTIIILKTPTNSLSLTGHLLGCIKIHLEVSILGHNRYLVTAGPVLRR